MTRRKRRQFYVPNTDLWRWKELTDTFLKIQLKRCQDSYAETENAFGVLDENVNELSVIASQWADSRTPNLRARVEETYGEIAAERKRITRVQERIVQEMDRIKAEIRARKLDSDRKLPPISA